jgi:SAM (Sterile alpha motif) domain-containing protein
MDIEAWLRGLGLEHYAPAFRDNDIDADVLPELTADDLISIGVTSVGHRRKLLAAITALREEPRISGEKGALTTAQVAEAFSDTSPSSSAERVPSGMWLELMMA